MADKVLVRSGAGLENINWKDRNDKYVCLMNIENASNVGKRYLVFEHNMKDITTTGYPISTVYLGIYNMLGNSTENIVSRCGIVEIKTLKGGKGDLIVRSFKIVFGNLDNSIFNLVTTGNGTDLKYGFYIKADKTGCKYRIEVVSHTGIYDKGAYAEPAEKNSKSGSENITWNDHINDESSGYSEKEFYAIPGDVSSPSVPKGSSLITAPENLTNTAGDLTTFDKISDNVPDIDTKVENDALLTVAPAGSITNKPDIRGMKRPGVVLNVKARLDSRTADTQIFIAQCDKEKKEYEHQEEPNDMPTLAVRTKSPTGVWSDWEKFLTIKNIKDIYNGIGYRISTTLLKNKWVSVGKSDAKYDLNIGYAKRYIYESQIIFTLNADYGEDGNIDWMNMMSAFNSIQNAPKKLVVDSSHHTHIYIRSSNMINVDLPINIIII